jgi:hypothetical protein
MHGCFPSSHARAFPPTEQLLGTVRGEGQTDGDLKDEEREIKRVHSFLVAILWTAN